MKLTAVPLLFATSLVLIACGDTSSSDASGEESNLDAESHIIGGLPATDSDPLSKSTVFVGHGCTGALVSAKHVLTAAHCLMNKDVATIRFGVAKDKGEVRVASFVQNQEWAKEWTFEKLMVPKVDPYKLGLRDLAVLHLEGKLPAGYAPVKMATSGVTDMKTVYKSLIAVGYGRSSGASNSGSNMRKVEFPVTGLFREKNIIKVTTKDKSVCHGDSGGPLYGLRKDGKLELLGVTSNGDKPAKCDGNAYFADVTRNQTWIANAINGKIKAETTSPSTASTQKK